MLSSRQNECTLATKTPKTSRGGRRKPVMGGGGETLQVRVEAATCCLNFTARLLFALVCASAFATAQNQAQQQQQGNATVACSHDDECPSSGGPATATSCCGAYGCCTLGAHSALLSSQHHLSGRCASDYDAQYSRCRQLIVHCTNTGQRLADCTQDACLPADDTDCCDVERVAMTKCTAMAVFREGAAQTQALCVPRSCLASRQMDAVMANFNGLTCAIVGDPDRLEFCPLDSIMTQCNDGTSVSCHMTHSACKTVYALPLTASLQDNSTRCNWTSASSQSPASTPVTSSPSTPTTSTRSNPHPTPVPTAPTTTTSRPATPDRSLASMFTSFPASSPTATPTATATAAGVAPAVGTGRSDSGQQKNIGSAMDKARGEVFLITTAAGGSLLLMVMVIVAVVGVRKCRKYHREAVAMAARYVPMQEVV